MNKLKSVSIFFPAYNDSEIIASLIEKAYRMGPVISQWFEVIVINDGSTDDTAQTLLKAKEQYPELKIITHEKNEGYGSALRSGFAAAIGDFVFYTDGDGQYDVSEIEKLTTLLTDEIDVVNGYKISRSDPIYRKIIGTWYNSLLHLLYKIPISDIDCDCRLIRKSQLDRIHLTSSSGLICLELIIKLQEKGARFTEVGVSHYDRKFGESQFFNVHHLLKTIKEHFFSIYTINQVQ